VPVPPEATRAIDLATRLLRVDGPPSRDFLKAIQRCLRELQDEERVRSVPFGGGPQLGWHRPGPARGASIDSAAPPPLSFPSAWNVTAPASPTAIETPPPVRRPVVVERRRLSDRTLVAATKQRKQATQAPALAKLREHVLGHVPSPPALITANTIAERIGEGRSVSLEEVLNIVQSQLRALQLRQLVRAIPYEGGPELGWHVRSDGPGSKVGGGNAP